MKRTTLIMRLVSLLVVTVMLICTLPLGVSADFDHLDKSKLQTSLYWDTSYDGAKYTNYRLPSIVVTKKDTVIVYGEARNVNSNSDGGNQDECLMDLYIRRSTDGGTTFGAPIYIAKGAEYMANGYGETLNNPCMTVGNDGTLHLLFCSDVGKKGVFYTKSTDDGITWDTPKDISSNFSAVKYQMIAFGPGHGVCLDNGRLVVSAWLYNGAYYVYPVYSDDNGATWRIGQRVNNNKDETCIAKTSDGGVLFNSRQHTYPSETSPYRVLSSSMTGTGAWTTSTPHTTLIDPACCGGMTSVELEGLPHTLLFSNNASAEKRNNLTVRCSFDDGITWSKSLLIDKDNGGYSDIAVDSKGKVYVIYEQAMGTKVMLATFGFYETFCAGDDVVKSSVTDWTTPYDMLTDKNGVECAEGNGGALVATVGNSSEPSFTLDVSAVSKAVNVSKRPVLAMRLKGLGDGESNGVGVFVRCGRNNESVSKLYTSFNLPNDGKEHTVFLDLSERDAYRGNLLSIEVQCFGSDATAVSGDKLEIIQLGFYQDRAQAMTVYPASDIEVQSSNKPSEKPDTTDGTQVPMPSQTTSTQDSTSEDDGGCGSSISIVPISLVALAAVAVLSKRRKALNKMR